MADRVTVRVPATSANLGSGFDCLGLALAITADVSLAIGPSPHAIGPLESMVATAFRAAHRAAGREEPRECAVVWEGNLPVARGLGASAAARAAGIVAANALMGNTLDDDALLALGADLEGHPDNMAPALFGGLQVVVRDGSRWHRLAVPVSAGLKLVLFVPDFEMSTQESRRKLPQKLPREDAVFNVSRAALLVAALAQGRWDLLDVATQDRLHQPVRAEIFPPLHDIFAAAKEAGAHAAYLSGAGSTVAALATDGEERIARLMQQAAIARGYSGRTLITGPNEQGATVLSS
ncbi:MAG: homoserine kinase [Dehalococcoidia bacterium]